jgi:dual specificity tyrosine-phosphorylation-regulated kinase 2/3/4
MLSINLYEFIKLNSFKGVSLGLVRRFAIQLLVALNHMREHSIVHCDLKPENILLCQPNKSGIKVIYFGSGTFEKD